METLCRNKKILAFFGKILLMSDDS